MSSAFLDSTVRFLREAFTENIGLKVLSFTFAVGLFAFMYGQQEEQQRTIPVAVVMRPPPEGSAARAHDADPRQHSRDATRPGSRDRAARADGRPARGDRSFAARRPEQVVFDDSMFSLRPTSASA